jgi:S-(hydroxymethyl)glutathione dehydrogenase/alcohol dehydrogenase
MKKFFKAAVLFKQNDSLKVVDLEFPKNLYRGQVLIRLISAAICGAQIGEIKGIKGRDKWLPHCMGHEGFGEVIKKHRTVKKIKVGDKVIMHWKKGTGINSNTCKYRDSNNNFINAGNVTTFQEYAVVSENRVTKVVKFNDKNIAPLLGCAIPTAWGILVKETNFTRNESLLIFGGGGVGITIAVLAKIIGSKDIFVVDKFKNKKNFLKNFGINFLHINEIKKIKLRKFDKVIDTTGSPKIMSIAFNKVKKEGSLVFVGQPKKNVTLKLFDPLKLFNSPSDNVKIVISDGGLFDPTLDMKKILEIIKNNKNLFYNLVTHSVNINNINHGINLVMKGKAIRVIVFFEKS